jgi:RNA polymerase sigma-70 factor, ECF subfamily
VAGTPGAVAVAPSPVRPRGARPSGTVESMTTSAAAGAAGALDDVAVLGRVAAGDREALRTLYDRHAPWLVLRLGRRCADPGIVDEVVQDTFLAAWKQAARYRGDGEVAAWLWGIALRRLVDRFRKRTVPTTALVTDVASAGSFEEELMGEVEHSELAVAMRGLSPEFRAVVQATVIDGLSTREAAALLGIPTGTVKTRMMRARAQLRKALT